MLSYMPVYLWRRANPTFWARAFLQSFLAFDPGEDVTLLLLLKGFPPGSRPDLIKTLPQTFQQRLEFVWVEDEGFDLTAYRSLCEIRANRHFLFLNSHSRLRSKNWWRAYERALQKSGGKGLIGASGSYESRRDGDFPNPHIRTNGFLVEGETYLAACQENALLTKEDCHAFEAGRHSLTRYFFNRKEPVWVVNSQGNVFDWPDWPKSQTFRLADQEKLILSDNRSQKYHCGFSKRRRHHARASWGEVAGISTVNPAVTLWRTLWERQLYFGHRFSGWGKG